MGTEGTQIKKCVCENLRKKILELESAIAKHKKSKDSLYHQRQAAIKVARKLQDELREYRDK